MQSGGVYFLGRVLAKSKNGKLGALHAKAISPFVHPFVVLFRAVLRRAVLFRTPLVGEKLYDGIWV